MFEPAPLEPLGMPLLPIALSLLPLLRELPGVALSSGLLTVPDGVLEG